VRHDLEVSRE
jgi:uncharacterized protein (DUF3084 family)